jgi:hypothetical protein
MVNGPKGGRKRFIPEISLQSFHPGNNFAEWCAQAAPIHHWA